MEVLRFSGTDFFQCVAMFDRDALIANASLGLNSVKVALKIWSASMRFDFSKEMVAIPRIETVGSSRQLEGKSLRAS